MFLPHPSAVSFLSLLTGWMCTQGVSPPALESTPPCSSIPTNPPTSKHSHSKALGSAPGGACELHCPQPSKGKGGRPKPPSLSSSLARPASAQPAATLSGSGTDTFFGTGKWEQGQVLLRQKAGQLPAAEGGPGQGTLGGLGWERDRSLGDPPCSGLTSRSECSG